MAPTPLDIKIEVILDNNNNNTAVATKRPYYYPGDTVEGKIFFTANQNYTLSNLRFAWTGRISVQPIQTNKDYRIYFDECYKLGPVITKSPTKATKESSQVTFYNSHLVPVAYNNLEEEAKLDLPKNKTIGLAFQVQVPKDRPLPSGTEGSTLNKIIYYLEAFIPNKEQQSNKRPVFFGQRVVPVQEPIYTKTPEMMIPQRAEQVFIVSLLNEERREFTSAMRVTLPCRGCQPGIAIPVSISIWNNMEFSRKQGISISLFRVNQIIANGRAYTSPGEKIHRVVTDLNITSDDANHHQKVQTVRIGLPIPKGTLPTISLEQSELLAVSYYIRVQIFAQEGVYTTAEGAKSQFMMVDLPFIVGTLSTPPTTPISSPTRSTFSDVSRQSISSPITISSPKTATSSTASSYFPASPPATSMGNGPSLLTSAFTTSAASTAPTSAAMVSPRASISSSTKATTAAAEVDNNSETGSIKTVDAKKGSSIGGIFRKVSSGSTSSANSSSNVEKKKKNVFSTLRLYGKKPKGINNDSNISNGSDTESIKQQKEEDEVSPAVVVTPKSSPVEKQKMAEEQPSAAATLNENKGSESGGVFNLFPNDESDDGKTTLANKQEPTTTRTVTTAKAAEKVFNMFPDEDSDEEEQPLREQTKEANGGGGGGVFNMFPDSDSDDEEVEGSAAVDTSLSSPQQQTSRQAAAATVAASNVFQMFDDASSDDEEKGEVHDLSISQQSNIVLDEREKPNEKEEVVNPTRFDNQLQYDKPNEREYKPDTIDLTDHENTTSDSEEEDESDILAALAKREKLIQLQKRRLVAS